VDATDAQISQMEWEILELRSSMWVTMRVVDGLRDHIRRSGGEVPSPLNIPLPPLPLMPPSQALSSTCLEILPVLPPSARPVTPLFLPSLPGPSHSCPEFLPPSQPSHSGSHFPTPALPTIIVDKDVTMTDVKPVHPAKELIEILSDSSGPNDSVEQAPGPPAAPTGMYPSIFGIIIMFTDGRWVYMRGFVMDGNFSVEHMHQEMGTSLILFLFGLILSYFVLLQLSHNAKTKLS